MLHDLQTCVFLLSFMLQDLYLSVTSSNSCQREGDLGEARVRLESSSEALTEALSHGSRPESANKSDVPIQQVPSDGRCAVEVVQKHDVPTAFQGL